MSQSLNTTEACLPFLSRPGFFTRLYWRLLDLITPREYLSDFYRRTHAINCFSWCHQQASDAYTITHHGSGKSIVMTQDRCDNGWWVTTGSFAVAYQAHEALSQAVKELDSSPDTAKTKEEKRPTPFQGVPLWGTKSPNGCLLYVPRFAPDQNR